MIGLGGGIKTACRSIMDDLTLVQGDTETPTQGFYHAGFGSDLDGRASPPQPMVSGYGEDFPGLAIGNILVIAGLNFAVADFQWDKPTDEIIIYLRKAP